MRHSQTLFLLFFVCSVFVLQSFYPAPLPSKQEQELLAKSNLFNLQYPQEKIYLHLDRPSYWASDDIWFKAYLLNSPIPESNLYVELLNSSGEIVQKKMIWAQQGLAYGDFHLANTIPSGVYQIRAYTNWMRNFDDCWFFRKNLIIWNLSDKTIRENPDGLQAKDVDVQFFPEGGSFVAGLKNKIGFKLVDQKGKSLDAEGEIVDDLGHRITSFRSSFKGIGNFSFEPQKNRKYTAKIKVDGGISLEVDLPKVQPDGVILKIDSVEKANIQIQVAAVSRSSGDSSGSDYLIVGQAKGVIFFRREIKLVDGFFGFDIPKTLLPDGIIQFTLFDANFIPQCERLVFINHHDFIPVDIVTDKPVYKSREKVQIDLETRTALGIPALANLSISVFNPETDLKIDDYPYTILSWFLLGSELKGNIEEPSWYFKDDSTATVESIDNLMLTHGYRHFEWEAIRNDNFPEIDFQPEECIKVRGKVKTVVMEKPVPNSKVTMMTVKGPLSIYNTTTDSLGQFIISDLFFNDTITVSIQALNERGNRNTVIELDKRSSESPPAILLPSEIRYVDKNPVNVTTYLSDVNSELLNRKWHLSDTILLGDINILMQTVKKSDGHFRIYAEADYVFDVTRQDDVYSTIFDMMDGRIPGLRYDPVEKKISIRGEIPAKLYLDGIPVDFELISTFSASSFDKIEILRNGSIAGASGAGGAVFFYTKRGQKFENVAKDKIGMKSSRIVGYSVIRKFYSPNYESGPAAEMKNDFRSTLYWNPIVRTDANGKASVGFYNSDENGEFDVVVEGLTSDGKLCRGIGKYRVKH